MYLNLCRDPLYRLALRRVLSALRIGHALRLLGQAGLDEPSVRIPRRLHRPCTWFLRLGAAAAVRDHCHLRSFGSESPGLNEGIISPGGV